MCQICIYFPILSLLMASVTIQHDTIEEFNVDSKAECDQLMKLKQTNASAQLVQYRFKIREGSLEGISRLRRKEFVKEMSFKSGVKGRGREQTLYQVQRLVTTTATVGVVSLVLSTFSTSGAVTVAHLNR